MGLSRNGAYGILLAIAKLPQNDEKTSAGFGDDVWTQRWGFGSKHSMYDASHEPGMSIKASYVDPWAQRSPTQDGFELVLTCFEWLNHRIGNIRQNTIWTESGTLAG